MCRSVGFMACDAEQGQEVGGVAGVAARRSGDVVAAVETQATPFSQVIFDRRGQSYVLSSRPPPRRLKRASRNRLRFISHSSSPQYRRNENNSLDSRRTRAMPWRAASRTSAIVSRQRLASSTSFRLAHCDDLAVVVAVEPDPVGPWPWCPRR